MDRTGVSGTSNVGSIPPGGTLLIIKKASLLAPRGFPFSKTKTYFFNSKSA
jgi:hypothetical protein